MNSINEIQLKIFDHLKKEICNRVEYSIVGKGAIEVLTPFLDWKGVPVSIFITKEGIITDGGRTLSQLSSLRILDDFNNWEFKSDFFNRSCIRETRGRLESINNGNPANILSYIQGITRLPNYFEPKPIYSIADKFPGKVKRIAIDALLPLAPRNLPEGNLLWASKFVDGRHISLNGIEVQSDMSPNIYFRMIQIISHATSSTSDKKQHIESKVLQPMLAKERYPDVEMIAVIESLDTYPRAGRALLEKKSERIIELENEKEGGEELAKLLIEERAS
jgi:hypothetical protein